MSNSKAIIVTAISYLLVCGFVSAYDVPNPNLNNDARVDFADYVIFANNWQQTGASLSGDFDDSNTVDVDDLIIFCWYWLTEYSEYQQCKGMGTDLNADGIIAFEDMAIFAQSWLMTGEELACDFDKNDIVDPNDLKTFCDCWLKGKRPESIWEQFKAALAAGDVNMSLTFISEASRDRYAQIFQIIQLHLADYVAGMGELILDSQEEGKVKYEMIHQVGAETYLFPVIFIQDEHGAWQIYSF